MKKNKHYLFVGLKNFYVFNQNHELVYHEENNGLFDLENFKLPAPNFKDLFEKFSEISNTYNIKTLVLSDICFHSQIIDIENFPLSHKKREEVLIWKLSNLLPYKVDSYKIKYQLVDKDRILYYALPITIYDISNKLFKQAGFKCWDIVPESFFIKGFIPEMTGNTLVLVNRKHYIIGMCFKNRILVYLKMRKKVEGISLEQEIELLKKIIFEKLSIDIDNYLICGKENLPGFKQIFKGFGFED